MPTQYQNPYRNRFVEGVLGAIFGGKGLTTGVNFDETGEPLRTESGAPEYWAKPKSGFSNFLSGGREKEMADQFTLGQAGAESNFARERVIAKEAQDRAIALAKLNQIGEYMLKNNMPPTQEGFVAAAKALGPLAQDTAQSGYAAKMAENKGAALTAPYEASAKAAEAEQRGSNAMFGVRKLLENQGNALALARLQSQEALSSFPAEAELGAAKTQFEKANLGRVTFPVPAQTEIYQQTYDPSASLTGKSPFSTKPIASNTNQSAWDLNLARTQELQGRIAQQNWLNNMINPGVATKPVNAMPMQAIPQATEPVFISADGQKLKLVNGQLIKVQ